MAGEVQQIVGFQIQVAEGWIRESESRDVHPRFKFLGYFMAFNALYWLWGIFDGGHASEVVRIQRLVGRLGMNATKDILARHDDYIRFLTARDPLLRMDARSRTSTTGSPGKGEEYLALLQDRTASTKLQGLASILYLIRCNLMHGSKTPGEALIEESVPALRSITKACLAYTQHKPPK